MLTAIACSPQRTVPLIRSTRSSSTMCAMLGVAGRLMSMDSNASVPSRHVSPRRRTVSAFPSAGSSSALIVDSSDGCAASDTSKMVNRPVFPATYALPSRTSMSCAPATPSSSRTDMSVNEGASAPALCSHGTDEAPTVVAASHCTKSRRLIRSAPRFSIAFMIRGVPIPEDDRTRLRPRGPAPQTRPNARGALLPFRRPRRPPSVV